MSNLTFKNVRDYLNNQETRKVFHEAGGFHLTVHTMSIDGYEQMESLSTYNPLRDTEVLNNTQKQILIDAIYIAYGTKEFEGNIELAKQYLEKEGFGSSNLKLLEEIKDVNPPTEIKIKDFILILAFNQKELRLLNESIGGGAKIDAAKYITGIDNAIDALNRSLELFKAFDLISQLSANYDISLEHSALFHAKIIFEERRFPLPDMLATIETPKAPEPKVNVNQQG